MSDEKLLNVGGGDNADTGDTGSDNASDNTGGDSKPWYDGLPDDLVDDDIKNHKTLEDLLKTHVNQRSLVGKKSEIPKLSREEDPQAWADFDKKFGVPEAPTEYGIEAEEALLEAFKKTGLNKSQAKGLFETLSSMANEKTEAAKQQEAESYKKAYDDLVLKYGGEKEAKEILAQTSAFIDKTLGQKYPEFVDFIRDTKINTPDGATYLANHPVMAEAFRVLSEMTSDDSRDIKGVPAATKETMMEEFQNLSIEMASMPDNYSPEYKTKQKRLNILKEKLFS